MVYKTHNFSRPAPKRTYSTIPDTDEKDSSLQAHSKAFDDGEKGIVTIRDCGIEAKVKSISHQHRSGHSFYKPASNRTWVLSLFLLAIGLTIGFLEFLASTRPDARTVKQLSKRDNVSVYARTDWRAFDDENSYAAMVRREDALSSLSSDTGADTSTITSISTGFNTIGGSAFLSVTQSPDDDTPPGPPPTIEQPTTTFTPGNGYTESYLSVTGPDAVTAPAPAPDDLSVTPITPATITTGTLATGQAASVISNSLLVSSGSVIATLSASPGSTAKSGSQPTATSGVSQASGVSPVLTTLTNSAGIATATLAVGGNIVLTNSDGQATATLSLASPAESGPAVVMVLTNSEGRPTATVTSNFPAPTSAGLHADESGAIADLTQYFTAVYVPSIIGIVLQSLWLIVFATFKMMEPFYTLSRPDGAIAADSLTADYLSIGLTISFSRAASAGHWIVILAGLIQLLLALVVTLLPNTNTVAATAYCATELGPKQPCNPRWVVNMTLTRGVELLLVACFSMLVAIIYLNRNRVSGVYSDPSKIATMADILVHEPLIQELRDIPPNATKLQIEHDLRHSRYMLGTYQDADTGWTEYGIIKLNHDQGSTVFEKQPFYSNFSRQMNHWSEGIAQNLNDTVPYLADGLLMAMVIILFSVVLAYRLISSNSVNTFNDWMNSQTMGPSWLLTCLGVCIGFLVKRKERLLRLSHPYVLLSKGAQPAATTITAGTRATQFTAFGKGLWQGDISLAMVSLCAILSDIMLVLIPGIPFRISSTTQLYEFSTYTVLALLGVLTAVHVRVTFKQWQRGRIECPETLAGGLMRLCASRFVVEKNMREWNKELDLHQDDFEQDDAKKQHERYDGENGSRRYRFAYLEGVDGIKRWMIEEDVWTNRQVDR